MGEEAVALEGEVVLEQTRADGEQVRLTTESLRLYPQRQYAQTDQDVMIESLFGRTMATGLEGDLQLGMLKLFSVNGRRVRTVLQPEHFK
jgi:LPS export ABC transporter protein LptC